MNLFTALINLANGYDFDVQSPEAPVTVTPLLTGSAAEVVVHGTGQSFVVTEDTLSLAAMASLFHSVRQFERSRRLLSEAVSAAAPLPEWAE